MVNSVYIVVQVPTLWYSSRFKLLTIPQIHKWQLPQGVTVLVQLIFHVSIHGNKTLEG